MKHNKGMPVPDMRLTIQLIPSSSFYQNLRNELGTRWPALSKKYRSFYNYTCQICNWKEDRKHKKYTNLHEIWAYDDDTGKQRLTGFTCVCPDCHAVHHWGRSQVVGRDMDYLTWHACKVNGCSSDVWESYVQEVRVEWQARSNRQWKIELGNWEELSPFPKQNSIDWIN